MTLQNSLIFWLFAVSVVRIVANLVLLSDHTQFPVSQRYESSEAALNVVYGTILCIASAIALWH